MFDKSSCYNLTEENKGPALFRLLPNVFPDLIRIISILFIEYWARSEYCRGKLPYLVFIYCCEFATSR